MRVGYQMRENLFWFPEQAKVFSDNARPDQGNGKRTDVANTNERPSVIVCAPALAPAQADLQASPARFIVHAFSRRGGLAYAYKPPERAWPWPRTR
jgi:hypothetical protein